jgi:broad specificity phosphatase PhoE
VTLQERSDEQPRAGILIEDVHAKSRRRKEDELIPIHNDSKLMTKSFFAAIILTLVCYGFAAAQKKTVILVRHAEKADQTSQDPELTDAGKQRAERLAKIVKKYKPGAIYSTDFKRTRGTAAPIAAKRKLKVEVYDPKKPNELVDTIMKSKTKRFLIVGHSNTIPGLANLLGKKDLFKDLNDAEHGVIWIVRLKDGQVRRTEVLSY